MTAPTMPTGPSDRAPKRALGRGLSALIPQASVPVQGDLPPSTGIVRVAVERIQRDPSQPRKTFDEAKLRELAESIRTQGTLRGSVGGAAGHGGGGHQAARRSVGPWSRRRISCPRAR
ncbi:MAG: ParB N-terminal domain-containing protein [Myxococcaceae bacterium]